MLVEAFSPSDCIDLSIGNFRLGYKSFEVKKESKGYSEGLTSNKKRPIISITALRTPKRLLNPPSELVLVAVKYSITAPIITSITPNNFSASDTQNVSLSSLIAVCPCLSILLATINKRHYFKLFVFCDVLL